MQLPTDVELHPVFHVSMLKKSHWSFCGVTKSSHPALSANLGLHVRLEQLLDTHYSPLTEQLEVLLKWRHLPDFETSWELFDVKQQQFLDFDLRTRRLFFEVRCN